jgi:DNA polymerase
MGGETDAIGPDEARSLIQWWLEAGVDAPVGENPRAWLRGAEPAEPAGSGPTLVSATPERPTDLAAFQHWLSTAPGLPMDRAGAIRIATEGSACAKVMLMSDLPAREDAAAGKAMGGDAWELTLRMLAAIQIKPEEAYVASLGCFHSPGARIERDELEACGTIARDHIKLAKPERLILFGDAPCRALLNEPLARARGRIHRIEGVRTIATFHPRWLLQRPSDKALAWRDLLLLMSEGE